MTYYAVSDPNGKITGFYNSEVHKVIPPEAIEITEVEWRDELANQGKWKVNKGTKSLVLAPPIEPPLPLSPQPNWKQFRKEILADPNYQAICNLSIDQRSVTRLENAAAIKSDDWELIKLFWDAIINYSSLKPTSNVMVTWNAIALSSYMPFTFNPSGLMKLDSELGIVVSPFSLPSPPPPTISSIRVDWEPPPNSILSSKNLQTTMEQLITIINDQQSAIKLLTPKTQPSVIEDTFLASDNTALDIHTPTIYQGSKWVKRAGGWKIVSGMAQSDGTAGSLAYIESGRSDKITIEADIYVVDSNVQQGIVFRLNSTNFYHWRAVYTKNKFEIMEVGTSNVSRINFPEAIAFSQFYKFKLILDGSNISLFVNNVPKCSWISATNADQTKHGLYVNTSVNTKFDSFKITAT